MRPEASGSGPGQGIGGGYRGGRGMGPGGPQVSAIHSAPQTSIPGRFWDDRKVVETLRLRPEQQRRMDHIFEANRPALQTLFSNLQREEARLSSISPRNVQDQTQVFAAIDRVAQARADLEKEKSQLGQALRQEMDPQQVSQLDQITSAH